MENTKDTKHTKHYNLKQINQHLDTFYRQIKEDGINIYTLDGLDEFKEAVYETQETLEAIAEQIAEQQDYINELEEFTYEEVIRAHYRYGYELQQAEDKNATEEELDYIIPETDFTSMPQSDLPNKQEIIENVTGETMDTVSQEVIDEAEQAGRHKAKLDNPEKYPEFKL